VIVVVAVVLRKLLDTGTLISDVDTAKEQLWNQLNLQLVCLENHVPKTPSVMYKSLVFLGGFMSSSDALRLLQHDKTDSPQSSTSSSVLRSESNGNTIPPSLNQDAKVDLSILLPFFCSFEATQRCTIWVQCDLDKGRINGANRVVDEATPNSPKKIYFGCGLKIISKLRKFWKPVRRK
jgi:hypothetical protein